VLVPAEATAPVPATEPAIMAAVAVVTVRPGLPRVGRDNAGLAKTGKDRIAIGVVARGAAVLLPLVITAERGAPGRPGDRPARAGTGSTASPRC
jgi:hypothetical protein